MAGKIVRHEFIGNWVVQILLLVVFLPVGILYAVLATVKLEEEIESPSEFLESYRASRA